MPDQTFLHPIRVYGQGHASGAFKDRFLALMAWGAAILVTFTLAIILFDLIENGIQNLSVSFLIESPRTFGREGGIGPIIISTLLILAVCLFVSIPLGLGTAVFLSEFTSAENLFGRLVRGSLDTLAGVPSIVFGLFGNAVFCVYLGMGFSILSGGLTLACMVLPFLIRATEQGFRSIPDEYRQGATALGMTRTGTLFHLLLPAATPGLVVGLVLAIGRACAETAALIFTSGSVDRMPGSLLDSGRSISVHIYELSMNVAGGEPNAYTSALVLVVAILLINLAATWTANRFLFRRLSPQ